MVPKVSFRNKNDLTFTVVIMPRHSIFILKLFVIYVLCLTFKTFGAWQESQLLIDVCGFLKNVSTNFYQYLVVPGGKCHSYYGQKASQKFQLFYYSRLYTLNKKSKDCHCYISQNNRWLSLLTNIKYSYARAWKIVYTSHWNRDLKKKKLPSLLCYCKQKHEAFG